MDNNSLDLIMKGTLRYAEDGTPVFRGHMIQDDETMSAVRTFVRACWTVNGAVGGLLIAASFRAEQSQLEIYKVFGSPWVALIFFTLSFLVFRLGGRYLVRHAPKCHGKTVRRKKSRDERMELFAYDLKRTEGIQTPWVMLLSAISLVVLALVFLYLFALLLYRDQLGLKGVGYMLGATAVCLFGAQRLFSLWLWTREQMRKKKQTL